MLGLGDGKLERALLVNRKLGRDLGCLQEIRQPLAKIRSSVYSKNSNSWVSVDVSRSRGAFVIVQLNDEITKTFFF